MSTSKTNKTTKPKTPVTVGRARLLSTTKVHAQLFNDIVIGLFTNKLTNHKTNAENQVKKLIHEVHADFFEARKDANNPLNKYVSEYTGTFKYSALEGKSENIVRVPTLKIPNKGSYLKVVFDPTYNDYWGDIYGIRIQAIVPAKGGYGSAPTDLNDDQLKVIDHLNVISAKLVKEYEEVSQVLYAALGSYKTVPEFYDAYPQFAKLTSLPAYHPKPAGSSLAILPEAVDKVIKDLGLPEQAN
jgi:hypothetical protein